GEEDIRLMGRAREGDVEAFSRLFARHRPRVEQFLFRLCRDRGKAEDGAQEVFLKLWMSRRRYTARARFTTFLYQIAQNHWRDEVRKTRARPRAMERDGSEEAMRGEDMGVSRAPRAPARPAP